MSELLDLRDIAILEERRQAAAIADVARESQPLAGGTMSRGEPGTWCNAAVAVGLTEPVAEPDIDRLIAWYEEIGAEPRIEVCPFVDPTLRAVLEAKGFVVRVFENALFRPLSPGERVLPVYPTPPEVHIQVVPPDDPVRVREYGRTVAAGFSADGTPREADIDLMARCARHERTIAFVAMVNGQCVAGGGLELCGDVAALFGLSVLAPFRRRGIQQALIAARLNTAAQRGARLATIGSRPGVATERNVRRMGFQVAYTKVAMVRPRPGLIPVIEL